MENRYKNSINFQFWGLTKRKKYCIIILLLRRRSRIFHTAFVGEERKRKEDRIWNRRESSAEWTSWEESFFPRRSVRAWISTCATHWRSLPTRDASFCKNISRHVCFAAEWRTWSTLTASASAPPVSQSWRSSSDLPSFYDGMSEIMQKRTENLVFRSFLFRYI